MMTRRINTFKMKRALFNKQLLHLLTLPKPKGFHRYLHQFAILHVVATDFIPLFSCCLFLYTLIALLWLFTILIHVAFQGSLASSWQVV